MKMFILLMGLIISMPIAGASFRSLLGLFPLKEAASSRSSGSGRHSLKDEESVKEDVEVMIDMIKVPDAISYEDLFKRELLRLSKGRQRSKLLYYFGAAVREDSPFTDPHFRRLLAVKAFCAASARMKVSSTQIKDFISSHDFMERIAPGPNFGEKPLSAEDLPSFKAGFALALLVWYRTHVDPDFPIFFGSEEPDDSETEEFPGYAEEGDSRDSA